MDPTKEFIIENRIMIGSWTRRSSLKNEEILRDMNLVKIRQDQSPIKLPPCLSLIKDNNFFHKLDTNLEMHNFTVDQK